jgi:acyl carrier protein
MASLDRAGVLAIVRNNLAEILEMDAAAIGEGQSFVDDLGADSLALIELVDALETDVAEQTGKQFRIEDEDLADLKTVRDAVDFVVGQLG